MKNFTDEKEVSKALDKALRGSNKTAGEIAISADIDPTHLSKLRKGAAGLDLKKLRNLSSALDIYPAQLLPIDWLPPSERHVSNVKDLILHAVMTYRRLSMQGVSITEEDIAKFADVISFFIEEGDMNPSLESINLALRMRSKF